MALPRPGCGRRLVPTRMAPRLRRECFDHPIVLDERHRRAVLGEFVAFDNAARPHRTLALDTPQPTKRVREGPLRASPVLGGLHHAYQRAA